jgi:hypothetical protein
MAKDDIQRFEKRGKSGKSSYMEEGKSHESGKRVRVTEGIATRLAYLKSRRDSIES